jgi:protein tyrosine/serine phosphatase
LTATNAQLARWLALFTVSASAWAGTVSEHPAPGTSLVHFGEIDSNVYKGSKPKKDADFAFLQSKQIKYILNLRFLPVLSRPEQHKAKKYGMTYISVFMNASQVAPSEKHVDRILELLRDPCYQPIYFHCDIGRDRTSLIATLYRMYFSGLPPPDAWREMKEYGFKDSWTLLGLKKYLDKHPTAPASLEATRHSCDAAQPRVSGDLRESAR